MSERIASELATGERAALAVTLAAILAIALAAIWTLDYLPTHDGPQHIYTVHAKQHLDEPANGYARYLEPGHPMTAHGFAVVYGPFDRFLDWRTATRAALSVMLCGWILGAFVLAYCLDPRRSWLGVALAGAGFQWSLYMGLFSFYIATSFGLWVLAYVASRRTWSWREHAISGALILIQALLHVFPALLTAAIAVAVVFARARTRQRRQPTLRLLLALTPTLCLAAVLLVGGAEQTRLLGRSADEWTYEWPGLWILGPLMTGGPAWRAWGLSTLAMGCALLAALRWRKQLRSTDWMLLLAGSVGLACTIALPLHLAGWDFFSVRFLPFAVSCLLLAFPLEALATRSRYAAALALALLALANHLWAFDYNRELDRASRPALRGLEARLERSGPRLAIVMDPYLGRPLDDREAPMPFVVPLLNLGQLYATAQGGFPADTFAISPTTHQVLVREDAPAFPPYPDRSFAIALHPERGNDDPELRRKLASYLASFGAAFEDVILFGVPEDAQLLIERGYEPDFRRAGLMLARFRGCPLALEVDSDLDGDTRVELGWFPLLEVAQRHRLPADAQPRIDFELAPCGPVWLRVTRGDAPADDATTPRHGCRGADASGRLILRDSRATPLVHCNLDTS